MPGAWDLYRGRSFILHGCEQGHPLKREAVEETGHQMRKSILLYSRLSQHSSKGLVRAIVGVMSAGGTIQTLQLQKHTFKPSCRVHTPKNCAKTLPLNGLMQTQKFRACKLHRFRRFHILSLGTGEHRATVSPRKLLHERASTYLEDRETQ